MKQNLFMPAALWVSFVLISLFPIKAFGGQYPDKTIAKAVKTSEKAWSKKHGGGEDDFVLESIDLNIKSEYYAVQDTLFRFSEGSSEPKGYLVISSGLGRYKRFDFMILYSLDKKLLEVRVLTYRSEYGSQITSAAWLRKFSELDTETNIQYGEEVNALSGATFSASSITGEINRLNKLILEIDK